MKGPNFCTVTYGCQMNERDSQIMAHLLNSEGYAWAEMDSADVAIINTCHIREHAEQRALSLLGRLKRWRQKAGRKLVLAGCVAEAYGLEMLAKFPHLDLVLGPARLMELPRLLQAASRNGDRIAAVGSEGVPGVPELAREQCRNFRGFVKIMEGCSHRCTFCVVPSVRGRARSRPFAEIVSQVEGLAAGGLREVTLLGQAVNAYGFGAGRGRDFAGLLLRLDRVEGLRRIRFISSHPANHTPEAIDSLADCRKVCEHMHLPVQSGADSILRRMRRGYTVRSYMDLLERIRRKIPGMSVTTDIIVGFPGETEGDFLSTLEIVRSAGFETAFAFKYSARPNTEAAGMEKQIPEELKEERLLRLNVALAKQSRESTNALIGCIQEAMVEECPDSSGKWRGRLRSNRQVHVEGGTKGMVAGDLVRVSIDGAGNYSLRGRPATAEPAG